MQKKLHSFLIIVLVLFLNQTILAQTDNRSENEEYSSLFSPISVRGYVGFHAGTLNTKHNNLVFKSGASAAIILNHKLALGFVGNGFVASQNVTIDNEKYSMYGGYGGFLIEPIFKPKSTVHISLPISIGAGEAAYFEDPLGYRNWDTHFFEGFSNDFIFLESGINIEVNLTKFMRFGISGSYLFTNTINDSRLNNTQLDGLSLSANLKLGWFK